MKFGAISPSFKLMINLMGLADINAGTGLNEHRYNMHRVSGGIEGRWRGDHTTVIVKAAAGYIQDEQTQQPRPHTLRFVFTGLLKELFICFPGPQSCLSHKIRQAQSFNFYRDSMALVRSHRTTEIAMANNRKQGMDANQILVSKKDAAGPKTTSHTPATMALPTTIPMDGSQR